jgi:hypothetical protein
VVLLKTQEWISLQKSTKLIWWITSALESNIGLGAMLWTYLQQFNASGIRTGALYTNILIVRYYCATGQLWYKPTTAWDFEFSKFI